MLMVDGKDKGGNEQDVDDGDGHEWRMGMGHNGDDGSIMMGDALRKTHNADDALP